MLLPMFDLSPSSLLSSGFPTLFCLSSHPFSLYFLPSVLWSRPPFIVLREWGGHHFFPTHSLTHIFPCPSKSQGILTNSEDSLGTCSRCQIVFGSGFLSRSLILADQPLRGLHIDSLCEWFRLPTSRRPLECGRINPRYSANGQAHCDRFRGHLP